MNPYEKILRGFVQHSCGVALVMTIFLIPEGIDLMRRGQLRIIDGLLQLGFR